MGTKLKIIFLDRRTIGTDIDLSSYDRFGEVVKYDHTKKEEIPVHACEADILIVNKSPINEETIRAVKNLKLVCVTATGTDNLDKDYLQKRGIAWRNAAGYSTETVAQHTFSLLFYLLEKMYFYDRYVKDEKYVNDTMFTHFSNHFHELHGKTWGIVGMGNIGRRVADLAALFGCSVIYYSTSGRNNQDGYKRVAFDTLLQQADIISVHAPLNEATKGLMNREAFTKMKKETIFLNLGRGPIVVEADLAWALQQGEISAAGLDVLSVEPMSEANPLREIKDSDRLIITPHIAWASVEARTRLMNIVAEHIAKFIKENNLNPG